MPSRQLGQLFVGFPAIGALVVRKHDHSQRIRSLRIERNTAQLSEFVGRQHRPPEQDLHVGRVSHRLDGVQVAAPLRLALQDLANPVLGLALGRRRQPALALLIDAVDFRIGDGAAGRQSRRTAEAATPFLRANSSISMRSIAPSSALRRSR